MKHVIQLDQVERRPLAVVRRRARPQEISKTVLDAIGTVWGVVRAQELEGAGRNVVVYWGRQDEHINLEAGVELATPFVGSGEVIASATPAGLLATTTHHGPYGQLHDAHAAILSWCRDNGHMLAGPSWEIYGHWKEEWNRDPSMIRTDVFYLLAAKD